MKNLFVNNRQTVVTLIILAISFVVFGILYNYTEQDSFYQNIISILIGTVLTAVILSSLLNRQSESDQNKEQNVELFKKKVEKYEKLITLLVNLHSDRKIDLNDMLAIKQAIYEVSLFCGKNTLSSISDFLKQSTIGGVNEENRISILDITIQMRNEFKLDELEVFDREDILPIDLILKSNFKILPLYRSINQWFDSFYAVFEKRIDELDLDWGLSLLDGSGDTIGFAIDIENHDEMDFYNISIQYPKTTSDELFLILNIVFHSKRLHCKKNEKIIIEASKLDVEYTLDSENPYEVDGFKKYSLKNALNSKKYGVDHRKQIELSNFIINDIKATEEIFKFSTNTRIKTDIPTKKRLT